MTSTATDRPTTTGPRPRPAVPGGFVAAVVGALALAGTNAVVALTPGYDDIESTTDLLRMTREHEALVETGVALGLVAALLLVPGVWALAARLGARAPVLAGVGGWLTASGYVCFLVLPIEDMTRLSVVRAGGDPTAFVAAMDDHTPLTLLATYVVFGLGALIGTLVLGLAALRQRDVVPVWAGCALVASPVLRVAGLALGIPFGPTLASLLMAAGAAGVWRGRPPSPGHGRG